MREVEAQHQDPVSDADTNKNGQSDIMELDLDHSRQLGGEPEDYPVRGDYNWDPTPADSDEEHMSERSWDRLGTPPPSPPASPLPGVSDEEVDKDEDSFLNITAKDYCEYDRWFGEEEEQINEISPSERVKMKNLIPLGIIPGPKQPKDFNLFLLPFVEEALDQARGVRTFDIITGTYFTLRAHPVFILGNMQAIKHVVEMKGVNAKCPCRACELTAIYLAGAKTYYIPLANPRNNPDAIPDNRTSPGFNPAETSFDPLNLPLRTHDRIQQQLAEMDAAPTRKQYESLAKEYGLTVNNTVARIEALREKIANYVEMFEKYYYQYKYEQLRVCKLTLHALLHVPDDVLRCGPVWVAWSFSIERYCRKVTACARSKVLPWTAIAKYVLQMSQLSALACRFPELQKAMLFGKNNVPVAASQMEEIKPGYKERVLRFPRLQEFFLKPSVRWRVAQYFYTNYPDNTFHEWFAFIPERCKCWGKLRVRNAKDTGAGDCIRSAVACNPLLPYGKRDASFIRLLKKDKPPPTAPSVWFCNLSDHVKASVFSVPNVVPQPTGTDDDTSESMAEDVAPEMVDVYAYGRLDFVLAIALPANQQFKINTPKLHVLAHITEADGAEGDAASELITFTKFGRSIVLDVSSVLSLAGRVFTRGAKATGEWAIIDWSEDIQRTAFDIPEEDQEDKGEYVE
ncbi:hypothetical protein BN14_08036 [Rhizoctonia solani AG-1 IB]|uniref:Uncharacterized protein n=1 Tax=Thanatephorus cucumeris (strain AG1-IB / isolate 7/3/14) TaxID=1108050 RepID=M5CDK6_THACB|nr:hypothetical protein BN14_08036 [Rhizoctonia solani AG-1 IB]